MPMAYQFRFKIELLVQQTTEQEAALANWSESIDTIVSADYFDVDCESRICDIFSDFCKINGEAAFLAVAKGEREGDQI